MQAQRAYTPYHPITGESLLPLSPIGFLKSGVPVWPIMGAEGDGAGDGGSDEGSGGTDGGNSGAGDQNGKDGSGDGQGTESSKDGATTVTREEHEALQRRMQAADKRASEAEAAKKKLEDKEKDELTKATEKAQELEQSVQQRDATILQLRLENAFLTDQSYTWHDPSDVLHFVKQDDSVSIGEDGKVTGMKEALGRLAKSKPYLVKSDTDTGGGSAGGKSGSDMNGGKGGKGPSQDELRNKYPALRR